jgi:hypothetical protein
MHFSTFEKADRKTKYTSTYKRKKKKLNKTTKILHNICILLSFFFFLQLGKENHRESINKCFIKSNGQKYHVTCKMNKY